MCASTSLFLAADHPTIADLLFHALGNSYQIISSPHRAHELCWLDHLMACDPSPAAIILEVDCLGNEEWSTFLTQLTRACYHRELTLPILLVNDYYVNEGGDRWMCMRKPFAIDHLRRIVARLLLQADEYPTFLQNDLHAAIQGTQGSIL